MSCPFRIAYAFKSRLRGLVLVHPDRAMAFQNKEQKIVSRFGESVEPTETTIILVSKGSDPQDDLDVNM